MHVRNHWPLKKLFIDKLRNCLRIDDSAQQIGIGHQADQLLTGRTKLSLGPYIITDWIGQGGMGQVFKAVHEMLGRESAIKVLPLHKTTPEAIENFRREIRAQAKLDHPNLVRVIDFFEDADRYQLKS